MSTLSTTSIAICVSTIVSVVASISLMTWNVTMTTSIEKAFNASFMCAVAASIILGFAGKFGKALALCVLMIGSALLLRVYIVRLVETTSQDSSTDVISLIGLIVTYGCCVIGLIIAFINSTQFSKELKNTLYSV